MRHRWCFVVVFLLGLPIGHGSLAEERDWEVELERGYHLSARQPLLDFLNAWHTEYRAVSDEMVLKKPAFEQDVYGIYCAFYKPGDATFVIIQDEVTVVVVDSDLREQFAVEPSEAFARTKYLNAISSIVVKDFRPHVAVRDNQKLLFLHDKYLSYLVGFVTQDKNTDRLLRGDNYLWEEHGSEERQKRLGYLNTVVRILPGHWTTGWIFETEPTVGRVFLSSDMKRAILRYTQQYGFGEALLEKTEAHTWKLISMRIEAIE